MDMLDVLVENKITYRTTNNPSEVAIQCTSGEHEDNTPSLLYNTEKDIFHCWSCGFSGSKRKFLRSIGITVDIPFDSKQPYKVKKLRNKLDEIMSVGGIDLPADARPFEKPFRGIKAETIKFFNAFTTEKMGLEDYVCFPVDQFDKIRFIEGRNKFNDSDKPKYNRKPTNSKAIDVLYPITKIKDTSKLIIVEGIFDMMNMWDKGYKNTVCIFGVNNLSREKLNILDKFNVTYIDIMFDGDMAGRNGAEKAAEILEKRDIQTNIVQIPEGADPGMLSHTQLQFILPKGKIDGK